MDTENEKKEVCEEQTEAVPEAEAEKTEEAEKETESETESKTEDSALEKELAAAKEQNLRLFAEFDNFRKRTAKEKADIYGDATVKCIENILPVLDNFELALKAECSDEGFYKGMEMILGQFRKILSDMKVTEVETEGAEFDPNFHHAIKQVEDSEKESGTVCEVFQKGYLLGDRLIRPAMVAVVS
jgi:molecular chaperone GrpE